MQRGKWLGRRVFLGRPDEPNERQRNSDGATAGFFFWESSRQRAWSRCINWHRGGGGGPWLNACFDWEPIRGRRGPHNYCENNMHRPWLTIRPTSFLSKMAHFQPKCLSSGKSWQQNGRTERRRVFFWGKWTDRVPSTGAMATMATMAIVAPWNFYGGCARCVGKGTEAAQKKNGRPLIPFLSFRFPYFDSLSMSSRFLFVGKPISRRSVRRSGHVSLQT